ALASAKPAIAGNRAVTTGLRSVGAPSHASSSRDSNPASDGARAKLDSLQMSAGAASWAFTEDDYASITEALQRFLFDSNARCALLVDRNGQLVATVGEQPDFDPTAFATLTAADFSANDQLARLIGETDFSTLFHQGERESMYLADVARRVILVVLFDNRTTLGLVRLKLKHVVEELTGLVQAVFARPRHGEEPATNPFAGANDEIDRLFQ